MSGPSVTLYEYVDSLTLVSQKLRGKSDQCNKFASMPRVLTQTRSISCSNFNLSSMVHVLLNVCCRGERALTCSNPLAHCLASDDLHNVIGF